MYCYIRTNAFDRLAGRLEMKSELGGARCSHVVDPLLGLIDHHVHVEEGLFYMRPQTLDNRVTERQIVDKVAIHYVQMQVVRSAFKQVLTLAVEIGQIGVQNRWSDESVQLFCALGHVIKVHYFAGFHL